jgi:hypothetical protein
MMLESMWLAVFGLSVLASIGAIVGVSRGLTSLISSVLWMATSMGATSVQTVEGGVFGSQAVSWICIMMSLVGLLMFILAVADGFGNSNPDGEIL